MQTLKSFWDQALLIWQDSTGAARVGIILLAAICVGAIGGVGYWSAQPNYIVLRSGVSSDKIPVIIEALNQANIKYEWSGSTISVDERKRDEAVIAIKDLALGGASGGFQRQESGIWLPPEERRENERYNREAQLEQMIRKFQYVDDVDVVLSLGKRSPFLKKKDAVEAGVQLTLVPNSHFDESHAASIASLVAASVPGLEIDNVSITDSSGYQYNSGRSYQRLTNQEKIRISEERALAAKAEDMLMRVVGVGNAVVKITTKFNFVDAEVKEIKYDVDKKFKRMEEIESKITKGGESIRAGGAGTVSNNGNATPRSGANTTNENMEKIKAEIDAPSTIRTDFIRANEITTMSVSVMVNKANLEGDLAVLKTQYEGLVKNAVGFDEARNDQFSLEFVDFQDPLPADELVAAPFPWEQVHKILKNISLGLAGLVAFLLGLMAFKKLTPITATNTEAGLANRESQIQHLSELVKQNPEVFSQIISAWSNSKPETEAKSTSEPGVTNQAA